MRVVLVCGRYAPRHDGVADYVRALAAALGERDVSARIAGADDAWPGSGSDHEPGAAVVCRRWDVPGVLAASRSLARLAPDVVHVQSAPSAYGFSPAVGLLPPLLRRAGCRAPVVTTLHEYGWWAWPAAVPGRWWRPLERRGWWDRETGRLGPASAALVTTGAGHAARVVERLGRTPHVIPLAANVGVDAAVRGAVDGATGDRDALRRAVRHAVRDELQLPDDAVLLAFFGFVHPVKGVRYLLEALARLRAARPDGGRLHLLVVGGFESLALPAEEATAFRRELAGRAADLGVAGATTVTGYRPATEVSRLLGAADIAVLPFTGGVTVKSGSLLACWAHRLPVVATTVPDTAGDAAVDPDLVDGGTAVLVPAVRDAPALATAVERLLDDEGLRRRVAAGGAARAAARTWPSAAAAHERLYTDVLAQTPGVGRRVPVRARS